VVYEDIKVEKEENFFLKGDIVGEYDIGYYTGCRKINVFQVGGLVGKNLRNLENNLSNL
jgi:hypothetical protein